jgi:DNA-3-methyladenine glycosylase I
MERGATTSENEPLRCAWPGIEDPDYARYHDTEWGVPLLDSQRLFEKLCLEGFQSGLSWLTILKKRQNFRRAFDNFDPARVARYGSKDSARLMGDAGIVRNRLKIEATIGNAKAYLELSKSQSFASFVWGFAELPPRQNALRTPKDAVAKTKASITLSKALKTAGFRFVGPTTVYAFMQSSGMVNDHLVSCHRHAACARLQSKIKKLPQ